jgi:hypothetical protein
MPRTRSTPTTDATPAPSAAPAASGQPALPVAPETPLRKQAASPAKKKNARTLPVSQQVPDITTEQSKPSRTTQQRSSRSAKASGSKTTVLAHHSLPAATASAAVDSLPPEQMLPLPHHFKWEEAGVQFELHSDDAVFMHQQMNRIQKSLMHHTETPSEATNHSPQTPRTFPTAAACADRLKPVHYTPQALPEIPHEWLRAAQQSAMAPLGSAPSDVDTHSLQAWLEASESRVRERNIPVLSLQRDTCTDAPETPAVSQHSMEDVVVNTVKAFQAQTAEPPKPNPTLEPLEPEPPIAVQSVTQEPMPPTEKPVVTRIETPDAPAQPMPAVQVFPAVEAATVYGALFPEGLKSQPAPKPPAQPERIAPNTSSDSSSVSAPLSSRMHTAIALENAQALMALIVQAPSSQSNTIPVTATMEMETKTEQEPATPEPVVNTSFTTEADVAILPARPPFESVLDFTPQATHVISDTQAPTPMPERSVPTPPVAEPTASRHAARSRLNALKQADAEPMTSDSWFTDASTSGATRRMSPLPAATKSPVAQVLHWERALRQNIDATEKALLYGCLIAERQPTPMFTMADLRAQAEQRQGEPVRYGVLQETLNRGYFEVVPDLTGHADATHYQVTAIGKRYAETLCADA